MVKNEELESIYALQTRPRPGLFSRFSCLGRFFALYAVVCKSRVQNAVRTGALPGADKLPETCAEVIHPSQAADLHRPAL